MSRIVHVILTGGVGSRLWPLSRVSRPKQYLEIFSKSQSLFELTVQRNAPQVDQVMVVGNQGNRELSHKSLEKLGVTDYIDLVEATPRNTAPAIAFAAFTAAPDDILFVTPADHIIREGKKYTSAIQKAVAFAQEDHIVTFGIRPDRPETGFGYIEFKKNEVLSFREKPDLNTARGFLKSGKFLWNSGMFCFKAGVFLEELKRYAPEVYQKSLEAVNQSKNGNFEKASSLEIPSISVDYAVMEKSERIKVIPCSFEWSDMGSFEAVYEYLRETGHPVDEFGNMSIGTTTHTSFIGLQDCIFIHTDDAQLILAKGASQNVKGLYQQLERDKPELVK